MKSAILTLATILSSIGLASAQNQLSFKADTAATPKLGFNKQNHWSLPLRDSVVIRDFDFQSPKNMESNLATSLYNMPVIVPDSKHTMPVHSPDTTVTYKKGFLKLTKGYDEFAVQKTLIFFWGSLPHILLYRFLSKDQNCYL